VRPLHVAVDAHDLARDDRGIGTYVRALLARFAQREDVRLTLVVRDPFALLRAGALRDAIAAPDVHVSARVPRDADVMWHPWNGTFISSGVPSVATVHDVVPFAFPDPDPKKRDAQQAPFRRTAIEMRAIACDSAFTAREVSQHLGVSPERLHVIPLGVDPAFTPGALDDLPAPLRGRRFLLHVGAHDDHKNVKTLAQAWRTAFPQHELALVFTRPAPDVPEAIVCERVERETLIALYRAAALVAVPSLYEGFGLPVLEAMACGTTVVASRAASLPEVGGEAVRYVDAPDDPAAWAHVLRELAFDDAETLRREMLGAERARTFTWERCALATLDLLRSTAA
jgi:glycosyltransferase involved in cell wall biosynthesis